MEAVLAAGRMDDARWAAIGRCLRRFHDAGVQHADLNAHEHHAGRDTGRSGCSTSTAAGCGSPGAWRERALDRLARSLAKSDADAADWQAGFALLRLAHDA